MSHTDFVIRCGIVGATVVLTTWLSVCLPLNGFFVNKSLIEVFGAEVYLESEVPNLTKKLQEKRQAAEASK